MIRYLPGWLRMKADRRAVTALEYGLLAGVIVAAIGIGFSTLATDLSAKFSAIGGSLSGTAPDDGGHDHDHH